MINFFAKIIYPYPLLQVFFIAFVVSIIIYFLLKISSKIASLKRILIALGLIFLVAYFGFIPISKLIFIFISSIFFAYKLLKFKKDLICAFLVGFFIFVQIYVITSLLLSPKIGLVIIFILSLASIFYKYKQNKQIFIFIESEIKKLLNKFNLLDILILVFSFLLGSLPQSQWDATQANLYNAKWYINNNSLSPLIESISSLYPQNAIIYYSLFYQLGEVVSLQIAYILPLLILIFLLKKIIIRTNLSLTTQGLFYSLLFTPIIIFQSSNGYYDLLVTVSILTAIYILYFQINNSYKINLFSSSFLIGFAAGMKYFPLFFTLLPFIDYYFYYPSQKRSIITVLTCLVITFTPLFPWVIRAYQYTNSPIFPYYQSIYPSPKKFWPEGDFLENNFMIQTKMNQKQWILGGFLIYPFLTFFESESFLEAVKGYTGAIYFLTIIFQVIWISRIIKNRGFTNLKKVDTFYLYAYIVYFIVGMFTRYYRYLWPYQLTFFVLLIFSMQNQLPLIEKYKKLVIFTVVSFLFIQFVYLPYSFKYFPINLKQLFRPNYYYQVNKIIDPIFFVNEKTKDNKTAVILDASKYKLRRFHFTNRVYQCDWYWIGLHEELIKTNKDKNYAKTIIKKFDYILTSYPIDQSTETCTQLINANISLLEELYVDKNNIVYKVKK